jgi:hypothetical protein
MDKVLTDARFTPYIDGKLSGFQVSEIKLAASSAS